MKRKWLYWGGAVLAAAVFCLLGFRIGLPKEKYDIVILGDSVIGNQSYATHCTEIVAERTGLSVFNGAFGGTCMSYVQWENRQVESSLWCMTELAQAVCYRDFAAQKASVAYGDYYEETNTSTLEYFKDRMNELAEIDFREVKILIIEHGTNDYNSGQPLENGEDPYDKTTFAGALRCSLKLLGETYPDLRIIVMSPLYCELQGRTAKCYETSYGGGTLDEYVEKEREVAGEFGVEFLDAYHASGIWENNADTYLMDDLHPSQEGQILLGNFLADYLLEKKEEVK